MTQRNHLKAIQKKNTYVLRADLKTLKDSVWSQEEEYSRVLVHKKRPDLP